MVAGWRCIVGTAGEPGVVGGVDGVVDGVVDEVAVVLVVSHLHRTRRTNAAPVSPNLGRVRV